MQNNNDQYLAVIMKDATPADLMRLAEAMYAEGLSEIASGNGSQELLRACNAIRSELKKCKDAGMGE